jgi:GDPmannose 4,6-dehydratase
VSGVVRDTGSTLAQLPASLRGKVEAIECSLRDSQQVQQVLQKYAPDEVYNLAAYSSGERMNEDPVSMGEVNGLAVVRLLEAIRTSGRAIRFCQASSSEMFGAASESPQTEKTPLSPRSSYGAAKVYAHSMVGIYRERHGLFACSAIVFNHESPRRRLEFVTRKITHAAARIKLGLADHVQLGNLDARRDWSFAGDIVQGMWRMLQAPQAADYVLASGITHSVRELCAIAFGYLGLDYRDFVREDPAAYRPSEAVQLVGDPARARSELGWRPQMDFSTLIQSMVDADLQQLRSAKEHSNLT